jgi:predicted phage terminase large subunit-like protein
MTRWGLRDLTGQVVKASAQRGGDDWEVIEFPAILPSGSPLWPEFWSLDELSALREELPNSKWQAQYQQQPTSEEGAIVKREWWKKWEKTNPPNCDFIIQSWDTAFETTTRSDFSACTTWGVWTNEDGDTHIILLDSYKARLEFHELKKKVLELHQEYEPDALIVEKKASGISLYQELRRMGVPVSEFTPSKGNDKITRLNAVSDIIASGRVWVPETNWAEELIDEVASFPSGEHDDLVDATTLALARFRNGGFLRLPIDEPEETPYFKGRNNRRGYYLS